MFKMLRDFMDENKIIIFSTHIINETNKLADYIVLMNYGKVILEKDIVTIQEENRNSNGELLDIETIILELLEG